MKPVRISAVILLFALLGGLAFAQEVKKSTEPKPISALAWLVGGVWMADASKLGPGMQRIETRYSWSDNKAYVRFTTHFVFDKERRTPTTETCTGIRTIRRSQSGIWTRRTQLWRPQCKLMAICGRCLPPPLDFLREDGRHARGSHTQNKRSLPLVIARKAR